MIFITTGSYGFSKLIEVVDNLVGKGLIEDEVIAQISGSEYVPRNFEYFKFTPDIYKYMNAANLVITHGGVGTLLELSMLNKKFVVVANRELADDHQFQLLQKISAESGFNFCDEPDESKILAAINISENSKPIQINLFSENFIETLYRDINSS